MKKIGLLYDSVSSNTGDAVIGECLAEFLVKKGIKHEIVDPFNYSPDSYHTIIVGGGFLLREPGDPYYDQFRPEGPYILNGVGLAAKSDLGYLNDYKLVTVRSEKEKLALVNSGVKNVSVVPCVTTLMTGKKISIKPTDHTIGIHLTPDTLLHAPGIHSELLMLPHDKIYMPFTHYNMDRSFMSHLPDIEKHILLENLSGKELFYIIGKMEYLVTSSLHASIFAYVQNIPFLTIYQEKTYNYFKDRGLENHIFRNDDEFREKLPWLLNNKHNFEDSINNDKKKIKQHLNNILKIIEEGPVRQALKNRRYTSKETKDSLVRNQLQGSIIARDMLIGKTISYNLDLETKNSDYKEKVKIFERRFERIESSKIWRARKKLIKNLKPKSKNTKT